MLYRTACLRRTLAFSHRYARRADSGAVAEARALHRVVIVMAFHERSEIHATAIQEVSR